MRLVVMSSQFGHPIIQKTCVSIHDDGPSVISEHETVIEPMVNIIRRG